MGLVDGTRELMRHDLEVRPPEPAAAGDPEAGITRRGFLVGAGSKPAGGFSKGGHDHEYASKEAPAEARFIGRAFE